MSQSHHGKYAELLNDSDNNLGDFLEPRWARPGANFAQFQQQSVDGVDDRLQQIQNGYNAFEPFAVNADANDVFLGNINFAPYTACP